MQADRKNRPSTVAVLTLGDWGWEFARSIEAGFEAEYSWNRCDILPPEEENQSLADRAARAFKAYEGLVFCTAVGIAVRTIAPFLQNKHSDPAVVVLDRQGRYSVSLLSGHEGGANRLAYKVAGYTGAEPVVTTATETTKKCVIGIGCRRGASCESVKKAVTSILLQAGYDKKSVRVAATIDRKRDEMGLIHALDTLEIPLRFHSSGEVKKCGESFSPSEAAMKHLGVPAVAEPCALLSARRGMLILGRQVYEGVTVAVVREAELA